MFLPRLEMKEIILIFITFSLVTAHVTRKWPKTIPVASSDDTTRIVGGNEAVPNSIPYQAAMLLYYEDEADTSFCGGSIISTRYVLTAAHCLVDGLISAEVILGAHNYRETEPTQQRITSTTFTVHEEYDGEILENDLGLVYLPTPANLNEYVQIIALPSRASVSETFVGSEAVASGWGYYSDSTDTISNVLRYVSLPIIPANVCGQIFWDITEKIICSGGANKKGVCTGDSGGPLVINGRLVGVTSYTSSNGCEVGEPSAYSRVTSFLDWIEANSDVVIS